MNEFSTIRTQYGPALCIVDTSRYDGFIGFNRIVKYLSDIESGKICVLREFQGQSIPLSIEPQSSYREWPGCFSMLG